jgi:hypothetical protein
MENPMIPLQPINPQIHEAIEDICISLVEVGSTAQEYLAQRDKLMAAIEGKVDKRTSRDISDLFLNLACHYGDEMFRLGLAIGRNPELMFDLPDVDTIGVPSK